MTHTLAELLDGMTSPDPTVRDGWAYSELAEGITTGRFTNELPAMLHLAAQRLEAPEPWTRSFAALHLKWLAAAGTFTQDSFDRFTRWYPSEADTRGFDPDAGWIHAVAHGADYLGLVAHRGLVPADRVLDLCAARMLGPGAAWTHQEDARLTRAILGALTAAPAGADSTRWLDAITAALERFETDCATGSAPAVPPSWIHNTTMTCAKLHLALQVPGDQQILPDELRADLCARLVAIIIRIEPFIQL